MINFEYRIESVFLVISLSNLFVKDDLKKTLVKDANCCCACLKSNEEINENMKKIEEKRELKEILLERLLDRSQLIS